MRAPLLSRVWTISYSWQCAARMSGVTSWENLWESAYKNPTSTLIGCVGCVVNSSAQTGKRKAWLHRFCPKISNSCLKVNKLSFFFFQWTKFSQQFLSQATKNRHKVSCICHASSHPHRKHRSHPTCPLGRGSLWDDGHLWMMGETTGLL